LVERERGGRDREGEREGEKEGSESEKLGPNLEQPQGIYSLEGGMARDMG